MGGGDLNMKKHFHPLTMENLERVWKAEEKKRLEDERIQQLQEELAAERQKELFEQQAIEVGLKKKKGEKLDWMYQGQQTVDTEAYLLGKKIDKNIDIAKEEVKGLPNGHIPTQKTSLPKANDVLAKIKEDPLFLIKKREVENRKNLLANPVKLRKMKALIQEQTASLEKDKKRKKRERRRQQSSSSDDESSDAGHRREKNKAHSQSPSCSYQSKKRYEERSSKYDKSWHDRDRHERRYEKGNDRHNQRGSNHDGRHYDSYNKGKERRNERESSSDQDDYKSYKKGNDRHTHKESERTNRRLEVQKRFHNDRTRDSSSSSDEDDKLEAQRNAMISNAKWRQEQRSSNTKKYKIERETEEKDIADMLKKSKSRDEKADFVQKLQKESLSTKGASVEDRIHRNIHSKQRTTAALNKKFTSR